MLILVTEKNKSHQQKKKGCFSGIYSHVFRIKPVLLQFGDIHYNQATNQAAAESYLRLNPGIY